MNTKKLRTFWRLSVALLFVAALGGCGDGLTKKQPARADIIGTYVLTTQNLSPQQNPPNLTAGDGTTTTNHTITLRADGTWSAINFPIWVDGWANKTDEWSIHRFVNGGGEWTLASVGSIGEAEIWGLQIKSKLIANSFRMQFGGQKPPYTLIVAYGDPDEGNAMLYERMNTPRASKDD